MRPKLSGPGRGKEKRRQTKEERMTGNGQENGHNNAQSSTRCIYRFTLQSRNHKSQRSQY